MPEPTEHHPAEHYRSAERTLTALASLRLDELPEAAVVEALAAIAHAVLAAAPRRARRRDPSIDRHQRRSAGGTPRQQWIAEPHDRDPHG
jgi:hypothetical protein